jgi:hypothetical protein
MLCFNRTAFCFVLLAIATTVLGQQNYQPGTITKINGETQTGQIDYRNWRRNPRSITFKSSNGQETELTYLDLASFEVRRPDKRMERYKRVIVQVDVSPTEAGKLDNKPMPIFKTDTLLLMILVAGNMDLYHFLSKDDGNHFFYGTAQSNEIVELVRKEYVLANSNKINVNHQYRKQLLDLVPDCDKASSKKLANLDFNMAALVKVSKDINECLGSSPTYVFEAEKQKLEFYVNGGLNIVTYDIQADWKAIDEANFDPYFGAMAGIGINWAVPRTQGKLLVFGEASYTDFKASGLFTTPFISLGDDHYITKLEASQLNFQAGLEWRIYKGRFTPYLRALAVAGLIVKSSQSGILETHYDDGRTVFRYDYTPYEALREYTQGLTFGLGTLLPGDHWKVEARFGTNNGISLDSNYRDKLQSLAVLVGYSF